MSINREAARKIKYALFGLVAGFTSAALGIGGGVIFVPVLVLFLRFDIKRAVGSSLAALVPITVIGVVAHFLIDRNSLQLQPILFTLIGSLIGVRLGIFLHKHIHAKILEKLFALLLLFTALKLSGILDIFSGNGGRVVLEPVFFPVLGLFAGMCSSFFGIGGGVLFVPGFYFLFGLPIQEAIPTSLALIVPTALMGSIFHIKEGNADFQFIRSVVPLSVLGAITGAFTAHIVPGEVLKIALALFLFASAVKLMLKGTKYIQAND